MNMGLESESVDSNPNLLVKLVKRWNRLSRRMKWVVGTVGAVIVIAAINGGSDEPTTEELQRVANLKYCIQALEFHSDRPFLTADQRVASLQTLRDAYEANGSGFELFPEQLLIAQIELDEPKYESVSKVLALLCAVLTIDTKESK